VPTSDFREYTTWDELCVLQSTLASQWQAYVTWYTWFFGINLLALSWIFSNQTRAGWGIFSLSALMVFCNFIGIGAAVTMRAYHHLIWKRATLLARENPNVDVRILLGDFLANFTAAGTAATLLGTTAAWMFIILSH
jgi:hypothetical protein